MNILNVFFIGSTLGLMALGTTAAKVSGQNTKSQLPNNTGTINLGTAANFAVLSEWGISNTGDTKITGDVGVSPGKATAVKDFILKLSDGDTTSTSPLVIGKVYAASYKNPTPTTLTKAIMDMISAYTDASKRTADVTDISDGDIGGLKLFPGVYKWNSDVNIKRDITLEGGLNDIWILQIDQDLDISPGTEIILRDGAQAKNIFWQVAGDTTLRENSTFNGTILGQNNITLKRNAILKGNALAQSRISLDTNTIGSSNVNE